MLGRTRTTKKLAQRIDLNYFKKLFPIALWRRILSVGLTAIALLWLGWEGLAGKQRPYNAGPLAPAHVLLGSKCTACHAADARFGRKVTDQACLACHDGPLHHAQQTFTPGCTDCHVEHQGAVQLASTSVAACTQCHASLKTKDGHTDFALNITSFNGGHPEFAALRPGHAGDPGTIKLNHQAHLKKDLRGPKGPVQMKCTDCHRSAENNEPWPYGTAAAAAAAPAGAAAPASPAATATAAAPDAPAVPAGAAAPTAVA